MGDILAEVQDLVGRYNSEKPTDPVTLLDYNQDFTALAFYLGGQVGQAHEDYLMREYKRKREHGKYIANYTGAVSKAKEEVFNELPYYADEKKAEAYYKKLKLVLEQLNIIITSIGQKVAYLRAELNKTS